MSSNMIMCAYCARYEGVIPGPTGQIKCTSFPKGIPDTIVNGAPHWQPLDTELPFKPINDTARKRAERVWPASS